MLRRLELTDMDQAAHMHRTSFDHALPWLAGLHTPDEDRWFYREQVFKTRALWGAFDASVMTGMIAFRYGWVDQLYVMPAAQGRGLGRALVDIALRTSDACSSGPSSATSGRGASMRREASN